MKFVFFVGIVEVGVLRIIFEFVMNLKYFECDLYFIRFCIEFFMDFFLLLGYIIELVCFRFFVIFNVIVVNMKGKVVFF